jgi:pimeloyl-ACP methyl ester carboxylesterase
MTDTPKPPRGVLVWLVGGPGTPGARIAADIASQFDPAVLRDYQLVLLSGRGTGPGALQCPELQRQLGRSDHAIPTQQAVQQCAAAIGPNRKLYSSASSVEDLEVLRHALGVTSWSLAGASYGTFLAEQYALRHPDHVARLVLDSVVPHDGFDFFTGSELAQRIVTVFRGACMRSTCAGDPIADIATLVSQRHEGPRLLDLVAGTWPDKLPELSTALHAAVGGNNTALDAAFAAAARDQQVSAEKLSQGLHTAAACQDIAAPWGTAEAPLAGRAEAAAAAVAPNEAKLYPFDKDTILRTGPMVTCQWWPPTPVAARPGRDTLPAVPTLILAGDRDLSTPLAWTQHEASLSDPHPQVVMVPGAGHITQDTSNPPGGRIAVTQFLLSGTAGASG